MTVRELIEHLQSFDSSLTVYVPGNDGKAEIAAIVCCMPHVNVPYGVSIPDDVAIMSQEFSDYLEGIDNECPSKT